MQLASALSYAVDVGRGMLYLHVKTNQPHGALTASAVTVDAVRRRAVLRMLCRPMRGGKEGLAGDTRALIVLLVRMLGDDVDALRSLSRENSHSGEAAKLVQVVVSVQEKPEEKGFSLSMNDLVGLLCKTVSLFTSST